MDDTLQDVPDGRSWHTFKFVSENKAVVYGGFNSSEQVLSKALDFYLLFLCQISYSVVFSIVLLMFLMLSWVR